MMDLNDKQMRIVWLRRPVQIRPNRGFKRCGAAACVWIALSGSPVTGFGQGVAQNGTVSSDAAYRASDFTVPQTRLQPIGAPSAVDKYRHNRLDIGMSSDSSVQPPIHAVTHAANPAFRGGGDFAVRQAALMQSSDASAVPLPSLPPGGFSMPPGTGLPAPLGSNPAMGPINVPPINLNDNGPLPRNNGLNVNGNTGNSSLPLPSPPTTSAAPIYRNGAGNPQTGGSFVPVPRSGAISGQSPPGGDYAPMPQPQLGNQFATLGNCSNISAPSGYRSDRILTCGQPNSYLTTVGATSPPPIYSPPPAQIGPPMILPPTQMAGAFGSTQTVVPGPAGYRPLISFGQERYPVQIGQGIFGQPVAYVPGQSFRNALRYIAW